MSQLHDLYASAEKGRNAVARIHGPVGCGKTQLLHDFAESVRNRGGLFLGATASRDEQGLPFGLLAHLLQGDPLPPGTPGGTIAPAELPEALPFPSDAPAGAAREAEVTPELFHKMCLHLLRVLRQAPSPVVIGLDDVHYADTASLRCLSYVVRRLPSHPLLVIVNESSTPERLATFSRAEWPAGPPVRHLGLDPLSLPDTEDVLAAYLGPAAAEELVADAYRTSGGNPALLLGLVEDNREALTTRAPRLRVGDGYRQALVSCIYRCDPEVRRVAEQLAVLEGAPSPSVLAELTGLTVDAAAHATRVLYGTGMLLNGLLPHPEANSAVLGGMTSAQRSDLHVNTANVLFKHGYPATTVARYLLRADRAPSDCAIPVLREAAEQTLAADGDTDFALDCLRTALHHDRDERGRAVTTALIVRATWRRQPYAASRRVDWLVEQSRLGHLAGRYTTSLVEALLWFGHPDEAAEVLDRAAKAEPDTQDLAASAQLRCLSGWLKTMYPGRTVERTSGPLASEAGTCGVVPHTWAENRAAELMRAQFTGAPDPAQVREAQQTFAHYPLSGSNALLMLVSLRTLIHAERLTEARARAEELIAQAERSSLTVWQALFQALRADILLRQGEPCAAEEEVERAVTLLPAKHWGITLVLPLAVLLRCHTLTGHSSAWTDEANALLPRRVFETPGGVRLLLARGAHHLARGLVPTALEDFLAAGELAGRLGIDHCGVLPWRTYAAEALVRLGDRRQALVLLRDQLRQCGPEYPRQHAEALRVLAAAGAREKRNKRLVCASEHLQKCEAPVELAFVLHDLGRDRQDQGHHATGRQTMRRAALMAERRGVRLPAPVPRHPDDEGEGHTPGRTTSLLRAAEVLSDAEMRVAQLAAGGRSNRQIASGLFVTVSTVEQHLTRIYRKFGIRGRADLVAAFQDIEKARRETPLSTY
ncbi:AAA family ATPase [Streptomyces sp. SID11385]|nr:AAA family ATPase [Streptomyces sp. SID11385]